MPVEFFQEELLMRIGNRIGRAVKVDETTMAASRGRYARVCVEVDLTKPLVSMITLLGFAQAVESSDSIDRSNEAEKLSLTYAVKKRKKEEIHLRPSIHESLVLTPLKQPFNVFSLLEKMTILYRRKYNILPEICGLAETISGVSIDPFRKLDGLPEQAFYLVEVKERILSTNSGQIGVLPNHAPIATAVDIGICRIRLTDQWVTMALMGGFARIGNNEITVLVNDAEKGSDIDAQEAQQTLEIAEANLRKAEGKRQIIEANLALRRARTRVEAVNAIS
ncbi:UNVERIFIED_CONTAM: ATP synthase epsilon chain, chloroplastic [Sesamum calycinum]|uniref:ATP synthase epsilon chain, chloroplastic n=1 Tax=Sesamum calycinum TaxID=2727403 RepID=A0AAW2JF52_9LAMI